MSLISLFVGLFLVYSSTQAGVDTAAERSSDFCARSAPRGLRSLSLILGEVALLGAVGVLLGLPLGYWAAEVNLEVVSATLTNLYLLEEISSLRLPGWLYGLGVAIGMGGAVAGALAPALDMSRRDTRALLSAVPLQERTGPLVLRLFFRRRGHNCGGWHLVLRLGQGIGNTPGSSFVWRSSSVFRCARHSRSARFAAGCASGDSGRVTA